MKSRAYRRAQRQRLWKKRQTYYGGWVARHAYGKMFIDTPKRCSCSGCSQNWERKHMGRVTRQEEISELRMQEQLLEEGIG